MHNRTLVYSYKVSEVMKPVTARVFRDASCKECVSLMADHKTPCCLVVDPYGKISGILRTQDILEKIVFKQAASRPVGEVMNEDVQTIGAEEYLYHAIARMHRYGLDELVVVDQQMHPVGLVFLKDAISQCAIRILGRIDRLGGHGDTQNLCDVKKAQIEIVGEMLADQFPVADIQKLLTHVNNDIMARSIRDQLVHMEAEGWGKPPVDFAAIVMGSGGRGENYLNPDQDNGFILADYPDAQHSHIDGYFCELAKRMTKQLNDVGFPYCRGHVMATNPLWRKTISQWKEQVALWGKKRNAVVLRFSDIFFDFTCVYGDQNLASTLRSHVMEQVKTNHFFLQQMFHQQADHSVALGLFGRFETEDDHPNSIDMKYRATLPLVEGLRLLALKHHVAETSSRERLNVLLEKDIMTSAEHEDLSNALNVMTYHMLVSQHGAFVKGKPIDRFLNIKSLSRSERERLLRGLKHVDIFRKRLKAEFTGDVF